jgi:radical SAM protein
MTRACGLACRHCRADAIPTRHPKELSADEGTSMLDRLADFGDPLPHLVFTGGDPLERPELFELIGHARGLGFNVAVTPDLTQDVVRRFQDAGVWMMSLSLDGSSPKSHDALRGVDGSFEWTIRAAQWAKEMGLPLQMNTLVCAQTIDELPSIYELLVDVGITQWALFFLVAVGRGTVLEQVTPEQSEEVMHWVYATTQHSPFRLRTTEAPFYRRVAMQQSKADTTGGNGSHRPGAAHARAAFGIWDGNGIMFVSHTGEIYPAGFLPLIAGDVRRDHPVEVYRDAPMFKTLRDTDSLEGKCSICEYRKICGGSRARAFAATGNMMESDPLCPYQPALRQPALSSVSA